MDPAKALRSYFPLLLSLAGALVLSLESYLGLQGKSLCKTEACEIVGTTIRFGEPLLIFGGAVFFWLFALTYFFSLRYPKHIQHTPTVLLLPALAFDGALIGFQLFAINQKCLLCISVAAFLAALGISLALAQRSYVLFFCAVGIWVGSFIALGILKMPLPAGAYANMAFYEYKAQGTETPTLSSRNTYKFTFIMSMNCPHCLDVVSYLSDNPPTSSIFRFTTIDQDKDSLKKVSRFRREAIQSENPFRLLKTIKEDNVPPNQDIAEDLPVKSTYGLQFLNNLGITGIPVLLVESMKDKTILTGTDPIIDFFQNSRQTDSTSKN